MGNPFFHIRAGHARTDITPDRSCRLLGYDQRLDFFPEPGHAGVHDPLMADVLILNSHETCLVIVTLDLCILETPIADRLRQSLASRTGASSVVLACSHTHSGPYPWLSDGVCREPVPHPLRDEHSSRYADDLEARLVECAGRAAATLDVASLNLQSGWLSLGYTRRIPSSGGSVKMVWDAREEPHCGLHPGDDPAFQVLKIRRHDGDILLWNAAAHAVVLGKRSNVVSADWPGHVRMRVEAEVPGSRVMFLHGAGGDVHPWLATGSSTMDLERVAAPAADLLILLSTLPGNPCREPRLQALSSSIPDTDGILWAMRIGPARLLAVPAELFGCTGAELRMAFPDLLLATTSNGWLGYWPPAGCFPEGGHEVDAAREMGRHPEDCAKLVQAASQLLSAL